MTTSTKKPTTQAAKPPAAKPLRELSHAELEACELEAHACVPEDATEDEAQDAYALALHKLVQKRQRAAMSLVQMLDLSLLEDESD